MVVRILQNYTIMKKNKRTLILALILFFLMLSTFYFAGRKTTHRLPRDLKVSQRTAPEVLPHKPEPTPPPPTSPPRISKPPDKMAEAPPPAPEPKPTARVSHREPPKPQVKAEPPKRRDLPKAPTVVVPSEGVSPVKLCGGEPISPCENCRLTHGDFALLLLDILALAPTQLYEEAFNLLGSLQIAPARGWARSNPKQLITPRDMEEIRCSISLAFEKGSIETGPSMVTVALNRFFEELEVSLMAEEDLGIPKGDAYQSAETGYQGGTQGVFSPSL